MATTGFDVGAATSAITGAWTNAGNVLVESDTVATFTTTTKNDIRVLEVQNFGFDAQLPSDAIITQVNLKGRANCTSGGTLRCYLRRSTTDGTTHDTLDTALTTTTYSAETRPGGGTWVRADLLNGTLTVRVEGRQPNNTTSRAYNWAWVEVEVIYTFGVGQSAVATVEAIVAIAGTTIEPLEGVVALTKTGGDVYEALVALTKTGSDPLDAGLGLAASKSDPWDGLLGLSKSISDPWDALLSLGTTANDPYEGLVGVAATSAGAWEGLVSLVASALLPVDAEEGSSAAKETTIAILALAPLAAPPTFTDHILRVRARKANPTDLGSLRCWLYEGATLRAGPHDIVLTDDFTTDPWQLDEADASAITDYADLRVAIQGIADSGEDLTVEASWVELHIDGQDVTWESTLAVAVSIAQTAELPIEALLSLATTHSEPYESLLALTRSTSDVWESNLGIAATRSDPLEALLSIAATRPSPYETLVAIATTSGLPLETLLGIAATRNDPVEANMGIVASSVFPLSALKAITVSGGTVAEWLLGISKSTSDSYEALRGLAAFNSGPWDTDGTVIALAAMAQLPIDVLAGIAATPGAPYEAAVKIASPRLLPLETLLSLTRNGVVPLEALVGLTAVSVLPWDTGGVMVVSIVAAPIDVLAGRRSTISDPYEAVKNLAITRGTVAEALVGQSASITVPIEAGQGFKVTLAEPFEALRMLAALGAAKIDSTVPLTQVAVIPAETLVGIRETGEVPLEVLVNLRVECGLPWEVVAEVFEVLGRVFLSDSAVAIVTLIEGTVASVTPGDAAIETAVSLADDEATNVDVAEGSVGEVEVTIELADRE